MLEKVFKICVSRAWESVRRPKARKFGDVPASFEGITSEWLTAVLCEDHPGVEVVAHDFCADDTATSVRRQIRLTYNCDVSSLDLPLLLFFKSGMKFRNRMLLGVSGAALCEVMFYNLVRPDLDIEAPRAYHAVFSPRTLNSMILMGDISAEVEFCLPTHYINRARAESQVSLLAKMHSHYYEHPDVQAQGGKLSSLPTWQQFFENTRGINIEGGCKNGFRTAEDVIPDRLFRREAEVWPATEQSVVLNAAHPVTLNHADVHIKNWYVRPGDVMGLNDWQCMCRGHWGRDLAYAISTALTVEDRRAWERDLLELYLQRMREGGAPEIHFNDAWRHYRQQMPSALAWWTFTLTPPWFMPPVMQPKDVTLELIRRMATAMDDLDSLDSYG